MRMTPEGREMLAAWEGGCQTRVYLDSAGYPTVGVGHLIMDGEDFQEGVEYDRDRLMQLFADDLLDMEEYVSMYVTTPITRFQFDALVSFTFNLGPTNFRRSTLLKRVNAGRHSEVPGQLARWNRAGGQVVRGLVRRREAEGILYDTGVYTHP